MRDRRALVRAQPDLRLARQVKIFCFFMFAMKRSIKTDYVALKYIDVYSRVCDSNMKNLSLCFHAALFVTSSLCIKRMKVVRKICIRPLVNRKVRSDVLRLCLDLIVSLVSRYYKDQQTVIVIFYTVFASEIEVTLTYIMLYHTATIKD